MKWEIKFCMPVCKQKASSCNNYPFTLWLFLFPATVDLGIIPRPSLPNQNARQQEVSHISSQSSHSHSHPSSSSPTSSSTPDTEGGTIPSTGTGTGTGTGSEHEEEPPPPPIAARPERTKSIVSSVFLVPSSDLVSFWHDLITFFLSCSTPNQLKWNLRILCAPQQPPQMVQQPWIKTKIWIILWVQFLLIMLDQQILGRLVIKTGRRKCLMKKSWKNSEQ